MWNFIKLVVNFAFCLASVTTQYDEKTNGTQVTDKSKETTKSFSLLNSSLGTPSIAARTPNATLWVPYLHSKKTFEDYVKGLKYYIMDTSTVDMSIKNVTAQKRWISSLALSVKETGPSTEPFQSTSAFTSEPTVINSTNDYLSTTSEAQNEDETTFKNKDDETRIKNMCPHFRFAETEFNIEAMADTWQTAYYELPQILHCFKIHIKKVSFERKVINELRYGNFSGKVNWKECNLEVISHPLLDRKHFLQGGIEDYGVLSNVIIEKNNSGSVNSKGPSYVLIEENPDQWLVVQNLLIMRDCDEHGTLVFSKVPMQPGQNDIRNALQEFGDQQEMNGKMPCYDKDIVRKPLEEYELGF